MVQWQAIIASVLIVSLVFTGCYTTKYRPIDENPPSKTTRVAGVVLTNGDTIIFRNNDGAFNPQYCRVIGFTRDDIRHEYYRADIARLILHKKEPVSWTIGALLVTGAIVAAVAALIVHDLFDDDEHWIIDE